MIKKVSGIYKIENVVNGKVYIGQTVDLHKREITHRWRLKNNKHCNKYLQSAYNKYGGDSFAIEVICECPVEELDDKEIHYIELYDSANLKVGYNLMGGGQGKRIFTKEFREKLGNARRGIALTPKHKENISKANKGRFVSDETKELARKTRELNKTFHGGKNNQAIVSDETAIEIIKMLLSDVDVLDIAEKHNIPKSVVYNIHSNRSYTDLMPEVREEVKGKFKNRYDEKIEQAIHLYNNGMSQNQISKQLHMGRNALRSELSKRGIDTQIHKNQFVANYNKQLSIL